MVPFVDLHQHFDGSMPIEAAKALMIVHYNKLSDYHKKLVYDMENLSAELSAPAECSSLADYLTKFDLPCSLLQDSDSVHLATVALLRKLSEEGVKYVEIRFAPQLHSLSYVADEKERFNYERTILASMIDARRWVPEVMTKFILCCMRNLPEKDKFGYDPNYNTLRLAEEFLDRGVVAVDLAGAEARDETAKFSHLFETAREMKIPFTIHAGEAGDTKWRLHSLESALKFGAKRIGHGIALEHSPELRRFCKENGIGIECCPVSNLQTKAVNGGIESHPLPMFLNEGLLVSVNTDNRTVSNTNLEKEFELLGEIGIGEVEQKKLMLNAIEMSFASDSAKKWLRMFID